MTLGVDIDTILNIFYPEEMKKLQGNEHIADPLEMQWGRYLQD